MVCAFIVSEKMVLVNLDGEEKEKKRSCAFIVSQKMS